MRLNMFKWLKSLFVHQKDLVEETRVIEAPTKTSEVKVDWDYKRIELTEAQYDDLIAHHLQELIDASKLPAYKYVLHYIKSHQSDASYEYPVTCYETPTQSADLIKIARRWVTNSYSNKCQDEYTNNLMLTLGKTK